MNKLAAFLLCLLVLGLTVRAQDITSLEKIGPLVGFSKNANGITLNCADKSQVLLSVLAPDLIRVRASFTTDSRPEPFMGDRERELARGALAKV